MFGKTERAIQISLELIRRGLEVGVLSGAEAESLRSRAAAEGLNPMLVRYLAPPDPEWVIDEVVDLDLGYYQTKRGESDDPKTDR